MCLESSLSTDFVPLPSQKVRGQAEIVQVNPMVDSPDR